MHVETFSCGPLGCNCSILADLEKKRAIVIDPGGDLEDIRARLDKLGVAVDAIVHTHTHVDHVGATAGLQKATGASAQIHEADRFLYQILPVQSMLVGCAIPESADIDGSLKDGVTLRAGDLEIAVLHTPGHTPGSVSFVVTRDGKTTVFTGDTLFCGSIGRTDLWGGDHDAILRSIKQKLLGLPDDALIVSGHGPTSTIAYERSHNPFLR
jgi:glyoxylase-like metal-dependent hydrolase (beta-lactamase superfamily II)